MTRYLLFLSLLIWPLGHLLTYSNSALGFTIYYLDICVFLICVSLIFEAKKNSIALPTSTLKSLGVFTLFLVISWLVNISNTVRNGNLNSIFYIIRIITYPGVYIAALTVDQKELRKIVAFSFSVFVLLGLLQYFFMPDLRLFKNLGFDDHYFRLAGTLLDPNFTGVIIASVAIYFIFLGRLKIATLLIIPLALTFSRASYLSFLIAFVYGFIAQRKANWKPVLLLPILTILIYLIPKPFGEGVNLLRTFSIFSRLQSWQSAISLFLAHPLFGNGSNLLNGSRIAIDNSYLYILATSGIFGLLAYLNLLKKVLSPLPLEKKAFVVTILIHSMFNNSFFYIWILFAFWLVLGLKTKGYS